MDLTTADFRTVFECNEVKKKKRFHFVPLFYKYLFVNIVVQNFNKQNFFKRSFQVDSSLAKLKEVRSAFP